MWKHAEGNNLVLLTEILEGKRLVALVAVNNKQHIATHSAACYMLDKVLQPGKPNVISSLSIIAYTNTLIHKDIVVLGLVVVLCFKDKEGQDSLAHRINPCD